MKVLVIDGQGGGVGKALVTAIAERCDKADIVAVGTNSTATANMLKGAKINGATGENAIVYNTATAAVIVGPIGILLANAMFGEITPRMAAAVSSSEAKLFLIPMNQSKLRVVGVSEKRISEYIDEIVDAINQM